MYKMFPLRERAMYRKLSKKSFKKSRLIREENIVWWKLFLCESNRHIEKPNLIIKQPRFNIIYKRIFSRPIFSIFKSFILKSIRRILIQKPELILFCLYTSRCCLIFTMYNNEEANVPFRFHSIID